MKLIRVDLTKALIFFTIRNNICFWWKLWKYNIFLYYCMRPKKTGQKKGRQVTIMTRTTRCRLTGKHKDKSHFIEACCIHLYDRNDKIITVQWIFRPFYTGIISSVSHCLSLQEYSAVAEYTCDSLQSDSVHSPYQGQTSGYEMVGITLHFH